MHVSRSSDLKLWNGKWNTRATPGSVVVAVAIKTQCFKNRCLVFRERPLRSVVAVSCPQMEGDEGARGWIHPYHPCKLFFFGCDPEPTQEYEKSYWITYFWVYYFLNL